MLEADRVTFGYGPNLVLDKISLAVRPGDILGLPGPSGCGKTTLAKILGGYLAPRSGRVLVDKAPLPAKGACPVQLLFQHPELSVNPCWTAGRILEEGGSPDPGLIKALRIDPAWFSRYPHELSGGQIQRICVARALGACPRFLVADEMIAMLDALTQARIWEVICLWAEKKRAGILVISHSPSLLNRVCTRILDPFSGKPSGQRT